MGKVEVAYSDVGLPVVSAIFANSYCENLKISRNLRSNFLAFQ